MKKTYQKPNLREIKMESCSICAYSDRADRISANTATIIVNDLTNEDGSTKW